MTVTPEIEPRILVPRTLALQSKEYFLGKGWRVVGFLAWLVIIFGPLQLAKTFQRELTS
jgi:sterol desaturase/sphingolipid hydroxylase (fatty acid hydroxylase superfamily)